MSLRKTPKRKLSPDNGKDGRPRAFMDEKKFNEIDWSKKSDNFVERANYPNRRETKTESVCPAGALHGKRCKECTCRGEDNE